MEALSVGSSIHSYLCSRTMQNIEGKSEERGNKAENLPNISLLKAENNISERKRWARLKETLVEKGERGIENYKT